MKNIILLFLMLLSLQTFGQDVVYNFNTTTEGFTSSANGVTLLSSNGAIVRDFGSYEAVLTPDLNLSEDDYEVIRIVVRNSSTFNNFKLFNLDNPGTNWGNATSVVVDIPQSTEFVTHDILIPENTDNSGVIHQLALRALGNPDGNIEIAQIVLIETGNWVANNNFETSTDWTASGADVTADFTTTDPQEGTQSGTLTFTADQVGNKFLQSATTDFGETVNPTAINTTLWVKSSTPGALVSLVYSLKNATGAYLGQISTGSHTISSADTWELASFNKSNLTNTFNQVLLKIKVVGGLAGTVISFDDVQPSGILVATDNSWTGGKDTEWTDIANWTNGVAPTATKDSNVQVSANNPVISATTSAAVKNLDVGASAALTVASGGSLTVSGDINIKSSGSLTVAHTGSVVQTQDAVTVTNNGTISVLVATPTLDVLDFMIMGSPMSSDTREGVWSTAWNVQDHTTSNFNSIAGVTGFNFQDAELDDWNLYETGTLDAGEGFLVRPQDSYNGAGGVFNYDFNTGTLNTGVITRTLGFNVTELESPNMLSNPYASAIDADALLAANPEFDALYFWEHNLAPSPDYPGANTNGSNNYSMEDVSAYNSTGGIAAPSGGAVPNGVISTAQGFGVFASAQGTATFNNGMRLATGNTTLRNNPLSRDRLWLSVTSSAYGLSGNTLIGFIDGATPGVDNKYDNGHIASKVSLYSHIQGSDRGYSIQGREAFDNMMTVSLGFSSIIEEVTSYKISLSDFDGEAWLDATPYLIDNLAGVVTNLMEDSYSFTSDMGQYNDRFVVVFQDRSLGSQQVLASSISMYPNPANDVVTIASPTAAITLVEIRDIRGRLIQKQAVSGHRVAALNVASLDSAIYLVTIATDKGSITRKLSIR